MIASDASWPPMEFRGRQQGHRRLRHGPDPGHRQGSRGRSRNQEYGLGQHLAGLDGGSYDAILSSVTITDDRKKTYDFSDPYFDANQAVVVRADDASIKSEADLAGKKVGAPKSARPARST